MNYVRHLCLSMTVITTVNVITLCCCRRCRRRCCCWVFFLSVIVAIFVAFILLHSSINLYILFQLLQLFVVIAAGITLACVCAQFFELSLHSSNRYILYKAQGGQL